MAEYYYGFWGKKFERTGKIFSGRKPSSSTIAATQLRELNGELMRAGLKPVRAEGRSTKAYQEAQQKAREALEEEERRIEQERLLEEAEQRKREEDEARADRERRFAEFNKLRQEVGGYSALFAVLTPDEAEELRGYDSGDMVEIGAAYLGNPEFSSIHEAATAYYAQQQSAFDDMAAGDYDADFSGVPFF